MLFTPKEMEAICVLHGGTVSETLAKLRSVKGVSPEKMADINSAIEKLSKLSNGEAVSLEFDSE